MVKTENLARNFSNFSPGKGSLGRWWQNDIMTHNLWLTYGRPYDLTTKSPDVNFCWKLWDFWCLFWIFQDFSGGFTGLFSKLWEVKLVSFQILINKFRTLLPIIYLDFTRKIPITGVLNPWYLKFALEKSHRLSIRSPFLK